MSLKEIAINIKATGVEQTAQGMKKVETAAESMGRKVTSATAAARSQLDRASGTPGDNSSATARAAAEIEKMERASERAGKAMHDHAQHAHAGMTNLEKGIMGVTMRVMNLTMAAGLISAPFVALFAAIKGGIGVVDIFEVSVLQIAAQLTQMQGPKNLAEGFRDSAAYARVMAEKLEEIDANSFANNEGLMAMLQTMTMQGVVLDVNNKKQVETFTSLSNAIAMYTQGQDQAVQARQEMRSLLTGEIDQNSQLSRILDAQIRREGEYKGGLKELVSLGRQHGDTIERLAPYLSGVSAASEEINKTWSAASSSLASAVNKVTREGFREVFEDVVPLVTQLASWLKNTSTVSDAIHDTWVSFRDKVTLVADALRTPVAGALAAVGKELASLQIGLLGDFMNLVVGTVQAVDLLGVALANSPGAITTLGVCAYAAIGGVSGLAAAFTTLTVAITASMATNPVGWLAAVGAATYVAAKSAVKSLDEMSYAYAGVNLTGEAFYNAEVRRAKEADQAWERTRQKAIWMYKEGGIKTPLALQDPEVRGREAASAAAEAQRQKEEAAAKAAAAEKLAEQNRRWRETYSDLRSEIAGLSVARTEEENAIAALINKYDDLMGRKGADIGLLQKLKTEHLEATRAHYATAAAIKKTSDEFKEYLQLAESEEPKHGDLGGRLILWADELDLARKLQPNAEFVAFNEQLQSLERLLDAIPERADETRIAIEQLKANFANSSGLTALLHDNRTLETSLIENPYEREKQEAADRYEAEQKLMEKQLKAIGDDAEARAAIAKGLAMLQIKYIREVAAIEDQATRAKLSATSYYTGMAGDLFYQLAQTQDESSRQGFETAKGYNLAAAIMSTAAAVMNALATVQPYPAALVAAGLAAATGAIQIAKIESTTFGGAGGSVTAPSGSFSTGSASSTVGSSVGNPYATLHQSKDSETMQRLADSMENASVQMRRVADGLISFQDALSSDLGKRNIEGAPNRYLPTSVESSWEKAGSTVLDMIIGFGGSKWHTTGAGVSLGINDGDLSGMTYIDRKKSGGWFHSDKSKTEYSALDEGFASWLSNTLGDTQYTTNLAAGVLGTQAHIDSVQLPSTKIKTSGRSTEDIQKDLERWLQSVGNSFAKTVDGLEQFALPGEEAYSALMRLSMSLQEVNGQFGLINHTLLDSSLSGGNFASKLVDLFGGLEDFSESMDTYFTRMFSDAEQNAALAAQAHDRVDAAFAEMELSVPATAGQFRSLVSSLDVTTEAGAQLFAALMEIAPAFADMIDLSEDLAKAARNFNSDLTLRELELDGLSAQRDLYELRIQQEDEMRDAVEQGMDLQHLRIVQDREWARAVAEVTGQVADAVEDLAETARKSASDMAAALISIGNAKLGIMTGPLAGLSPEVAYLQAKAAYDAVAGKSDLASLQKLPSLSQALLEASRGYNASGAGYQEDLTRVLAEMDRALGLTPGSGVSETQKQLTVLEQIRDALGANSPLVDALGPDSDLVRALGPNSTLAVLIGTWNENTKAKLAEEQKAAAVENFNREVTRYGAAVDTLKSDFAAGKITWSQFQNQSTALYSPVQTAWGTAQSLGATGLTSPGIAGVDPILGRNTDLLLSQLKAKLYQELAGDPMGLYPPFEGTWYWEDDDRYFSPQEIRDHYNETKYYQLDRLINYARQYHLAGYAKGGFYPGGSALMGEYGPELVDSSPGYVYRADETRALFAAAQRGVSSPDNYSQSNAEQVSELKEQNRLLREMVAELQKGNRISQAGFGQLADQGEQNNQNGAQLARQARMAGAR